MSARPRGAAEREAVLHPAGLSQTPTPLVRTRPAANSAAGEGYSCVDFGNSCRVSLMLAPQGRGSLKEQLQELLLAQQEVLARKGTEMSVTSQTVFLRDPSDLNACRQLLSERYGAKFPATNFVFQAPCCGAALALEAWAIGGEGVRVEYRGPHTVVVEHDGARWIYCSGIQALCENGDTYAQTREALEKMRLALKVADSGFEQVVRTWFYLGSITEPDKSSQRYKELNRARSDFYHGISFQCSPVQPQIPQGVYPASTGIGMGGTELVAACLALQTQRSDAFLVSLENPQQTPAYAYHPRFSPQSPKFSRGVALVLGDQVTTWLSGTASVVHSISRHPGDIQNQTHQTIDNIERLISADNFGFHGIHRASPRLSDLAKIRVYLKYPEDFPACKAICQERFGAVPAIYAVADVCRPELLVEIEGVAFTRLRTASTSASFSVPRL